MEHQITYKSPNALSPSPERYAVDPFYQHQLIRSALSVLLLDPFEQSRDLRGAEITLQVHEDGLHVTSTLDAHDLPALEEPPGEVIEELLTAAQRVRDRIMRRQRGVDTVDLLKDL